MKGYVTRRVLVGGLQNRLLAVTAMHFLAIAVVFILTLYVPLAIRLSGNGGLDLDGLRAARDTLALNTHVWPALLLTFALLLLHDVVVTHRVAGPLDRLRQEFEMIGHGDLSRHVRVRRTDYLYDDAVAIDTMVVRLRARVDTIKDAHKSANNALIELEQAAATDSRERFANALRALRQDLEGAGAELDRFTLVAEEESREPAAETQPAHEPEPAV